MIEYYIAILIFLLIILSMGYFINEWRNVIQNVNIQTLNSLDYDDQPITTIAKVNLHQPCVLTTDTTVYDGTKPVCDETKDLICVTGLYEANDNGSSGVCLSKVGGYCNTLYDCEPNAQVCLKNTCENISETINLPCNYDSDCIGAVTCIGCATGKGSCKNSDNECIEADVNGDCPDSYNKCGITSESTNLEFRFNHICDKDLQLPVCKFNISPKDQGCYRDSDCVSFGGESFCFRGDFKTSYNPDGVIEIPVFGVKLITILNYTNDTGDSISTTSVQIDFGNRLLTSESFFAGTEVNFIKGDLNNSRTTISYGKYYIRESFDSDKIIIGNTKMEPEIDIYYNVPNNIIELDESEYKKPGEFDLSESEIDIVNNPIGYQIIFGPLPPMIILSKCYLVGDTFTLVDDDTNFNLLNKIKIGTEVRFSDTAVEGYIQDASMFTISEIESNGKAFKVNEGDISSLTSFNDVSKLLQVMFGKKILEDNLNKAKGICITKLPPSANIEDSKYNILNYNEVNPCISNFDNILDVSLVDNFCKFTNKQSGVGSLCQFERKGDDGTKYNPLPCADETTTVNGLTYNLECLINDDLSGYMRNNFNFLNSSFGGICAYPVNEKFKTCDVYLNNCKPPYVCSEMNGGTFCDTRLDILQCNVNYSCPPRYECSDGLCLGVSGSGICTTKNDCISNSCSGGISLKYYNTDSFTDSSSIDEIKDVVDLFEFTDISNTKLLVKSTFGDSGIETYCFVYNGVIAKFFTITDFHKPILTITPIQITFPINNMKGKFKLILNNNGVCLVNDNTIVYPPGQTPQPVLTTDYIAFDYLKSKTVYVEEDTDQNRPKFYLKSTADPVLQKNYTIYYNSTDVKYPVPHYLNTMTNLIDVRFDRKNLNDYIDVTTVYSRSDENSYTDNILGLRHKVFKSTIDNNNILISGKNVLSPKIKIIKVDNANENSTTGFEYKLTDASDINTLMTFSGYKIALVPLKTTDPQDVNLKHLQSTDTYYTITKIKYIDNIVTYLTSAEIPENAPATGPKNENENTKYKTLTSYANIQLLESPNFIPYNLTPTDYKNNFNNCLSPVLEYPIWLTDINDLIVGDSYIPKINYIYYEPNDTRDTYYLALDMYTGYSDPETNAILRSEDSNIQNQEYLFKFSSGKTDLDLIQNQAIPIRLTDGNFDRLSLCNETENLFFLTKTCG